MYNYVPLIKVGILDKNRVLQRKLNKIAASADTLSISGLNCLLKGALLLQKLQSVSLFFTTTLHCAIYFTTTYLCTLTTCSKYDRHASISLVFAYKSIGSGCMKELELQFFRMASTNISMNKIHVKVKLISSLGMCLP